MAKYDDLHNYLKARIGQQQVALTFREIERILRTTLPPSARDHRPWWANTPGNVAGQSWLKAGFRVIEVNLQTERVVFGHDAPAPGSPEAPGRAANPRAGSTPPPKPPAPPTTRQGPSATTVGPEAAITTPPTWDPLIALAKRRPIFHSEADFQFELAWTLRETGYRDIRLEKPVRPTEGKGRMYIDLFAVDPGGQRVAIELKYWTSKFTGPVREESFDLANQGAQDLSRYDFWRDVTRVEALVGDPRHRVHVGYVIALTLDASYLRPARGNPVDAAFRLEDGREVKAGDLGWGAGVGPGTAKGRTDALPLAHDYTVRWTRYSAEEPPVWCLMLEVPPR